jgi:replication-associated recombination protein RarA
MSVLKNHSTFRLKRKNLFLWGDPGTGKTWLARTRVGPTSHLKQQNKGWDAPQEDVFAQEEEDETKPLN